MSTTRVYLLCLLVGCNGSSSAVKPVPAEQPKPLPAPAEPPKPDPVKPAPLPKADPPKPKEEPKPEPKPDSVEGIEKMLTTYLTTELHERGKFTADPDEYLKTYQNFYSKKTPRIAKVELKVLEKSDGPKAGYTTVKASQTLTERSGKESTETKAWYLVLGKPGPKIDWPSTVGHNTVTFKGWQADKEPSMITRVEATISDEYRGSYEKNAKGNFHSVKLVRKAGGLHEVIYGYVEKKGDPGGRLFELLKDGHPHHLTLKVTKVLNFGYETTNEVSITEILSETWVPKD